RVTRRGDVCNKIGTYLRALAARHHGVPFYVAVPSPTIDWAVDDGMAHIPIEERDGAELRRMTGVDAAGATSTVSLLPETTPVANPGFDVTPAEFVSGLITERGVIAANEAELTALFPESCAPAK